jgi:hypothetical protein
VGPLLALAGVGLAGGCLASRVLAELAAPLGTAIPLSLVAIHLLVADRVNQPRVLGLWIEHPQATAAIAALTCLVSLSEGGLASRLPRPNGLRRS